MYVTFKVTKSIKNYVVCFYLQNLLKFLTFNKTDVKIFDIYNTV